MKILVIRLSSIGDVVLTMPVVGWLKSEGGVAELHFLTKRQNAALLSGLTEIDKVHCYDSSIEETVEELRKEHFDAVLDLHNNHRSKRVRRALGVKSYVYNKENAGKMLYVMTKHDFMSGRHVVDRYLDAAKSLCGVKNSMETKDCTYPVWHLQETMFPDRCAEWTAGEPYVVVACGAQHATKRIPADKIAMLVEKAERKVVLVGDSEDRKRIETAGTNMSGDVMNLCGETSLLEMVAVVSKASVVVTSDSAVMHIASAFQRPVIAVWGATVPSFGFWAYNTERYDYEVVGLRCRPCSRMGTERCRKGHMDCMERQDWDGMVKKMNSINR